MERVFVLGDSRTGTTSLHRFFLDLGYNSIHYYNDLEGLSVPMYRDYDGNWQILKKFYLTTSYNAFSDYPTRFYWKEIVDLFPDAYYILSMRKSIETWQESMSKYFAKRDNKNNFGLKINIDKLTKIHIELNQQIQGFFYERPASHFIDLVIDEDSDLNSEKLKRFLEKEASSVKLKKHNHTK